jgi:hypothetical protein
MVCDCLDGFRCMEAERLWHRASTLRQLARSGKGSWDRYDEARREYDDHRKERPS